MSKYITLDNLTTYHNKVRNAINNASSAANPMENITYSALLSKVNSSTLTPGKKYRITDYCTTTDGDNDSTKEYRSAQHPFDLIVTATSGNTLNPIASAAVHAGDTYFSNSDLSKWIIWYSLVSTSDKYEWGGTKGIIYRMIDEKNNDLPYDFKNVQFKRTLIVSVPNAPSNIQSGFPGRYGTQIFSTMQMDDTKSFYFYTFTIIDSEENTENINEEDIKDASLRGDVCSNYIEAIIERNISYVETANVVKHYLNNIVFLSSYKTVTNRQYLYCSNNIFQGRAIRLTFILDYSEGLSSTDKVKNNVFTGEVEACIFIGSVYHNIIRGVFGINLIGNDFLYNNVHGLNSSMIGCNFKHNIVSGIYNSRIEDDWIGNTIGKNVNILVSIGSDHIIEYSTFEGNVDYNLDDEFWNLSPIQNDHLHFAEGNTNYEYATTTMSASSNALTGQVYERTSSTPSVWAIKNISIPLT